MRPVIDVPGWCFSSVRSKSYIGDNIHLASRFAGADVCFRAREPPGFQWERELRFRDARPGLGCVEVRNRLGSSLPLVGSTDCKYQITNSGL